jgi:hypothetical protein
VEFRACLFNAFNNVNFSPNILDLNLDLGFVQNFGRIQSTAGPRGGAREMEFAIRYEF